MSEMGIAYRVFEQQLVESKLQAATLDMEADELSVELTQKNIQLKKIQTKYTKMEIDLVQLQALHDTNDESGEQTESSEMAAQHLSP